LLLVIEVLMLGMGGLTYLTILIAGVSFAVVTVPRSAVGTLTAAPLGPLVKWTQGLFFRYQVEENSVF
jgi:hypothetical protein